MSVERMIQCTTCRGSGEMESSDSTDDRIYECWACDGTRKIADRRKPDPALEGAVAGLRCREQEIKTVLGLLERAYDICGPNELAEEIRVTLEALGGR